MNANRTELTTCFFDANWRRQRGFAGGCLNRFWPSADASGNLRNVEPKTFCDIAVRLTGKP